MKTKNVLFVAIVWFVSLVGVGLWAQSSDLKKVQTRMEGEPVGEVITGQNIGFLRVSSTNVPNGKVVGKWMVKVDGIWLEAQTAVGIVR